MGAYGLYMHNLQGIEVEAPTTPGVYIRRQGSECRKVVVK